MTNACIPTWLMTLQGWDVEARYAQNYKSSLGNGVAACQDCSTDMLYTSEEPKEPPQPQLTNHRYFKDNVCKGRPAAYVDGCSYNHKGNLKAGAGVVRLNNDPCPPHQINLGPHSSQYAEIAVILITLQLAASHNIKKTPHLYRLELCPPEHVSEAERCYAQLNIPLCGHALCSVTHCQNKRSANVPLTLTGRPNPTQIML